MDKDAVVYDQMVQEGIRVLVLRGPFSFCAYVGVPNDHPWAGKPYDDIDISVHGGLTFADYGATESNWSEGWYWWGWDYAHYGDACPRIGEHGRVWTAEEVIKEAQEGAADLIRYMRENPIEFVLEEASNG